MSVSTRFALAVEVLTLLAANKKSSMTSEQLAAVCAANPAVVRRILSKLGSAGLTTAQTGKGGGAMLARPAKKIDMAEIYQAVESAALVVGRGGDRRSKNSADFDPAFAALSTSAENAFLAALHKQTLKQFLKQVKLQKIS